MLRFVLRKMTWAIAWNGERETSVQKIKQKASVVIQRKTDDQEEWWWWWRAHQNMWYLVKVRVCVCVRERVSERDIPKFVAC